MNCPRCGTEIPSGYQECFYCGYNLSHHVAQTKKPTYKTYYYTDFLFLIIGLSSAIVSLFVVPIVFGIVGITSGAMIMRGHRKALGLSLIIFAFFCLTVGTLRETHIQNG